MSPNVYLGIISSIRIAYCFVHIEICIGSFLIDTALMLSNKFYLYMYIKNIILVQCHYNTT